MFIYTLVILALYLLVQFSDIAKEKNGGTAVIYAIVTILMSVPYIYLLFIL
jgi:hypothetical protein